MKFLMDGSFFFFFFLNNRLFRRYAYGIPYDSSLFKVCFQMNQCDAYVGFKLQESQKNKKRVLLEVEIFCHCIR
jgi:hypothetical protein